jgi:hypothetical protein
VNGEPNYSALDRALHRLAFANSAIQETAADIESSIFAARFRHIRVERPIFVTSLPRAGTTLVLEVLARVPGIATHTYRDMPFVLAPLLWDALSKGFRRPSHLRERTHGDGMAVGYDSPEAFEEVLWRAHWAEKFRNDHIALWTERDNPPQFRDAFFDHARKIIALRAEGAPAGRYASKNNANIARIRLLRGLFPDCVILVPFRDPLAQAKSLLQQHRRFSALHSTDGFSKQYMFDIGHFEFGHLHRPIAFAGVEEMRRRYGPDTLDYWVAYWECAIRHLLRHRDDFVALSYETLCERGPQVMPILAERLGIPPDMLVAALGDRMRSQRDHGHREQLQDPDLEPRVRALYQELLTSSV